MIEHLLIISAELIKDIIREREVKDDIERQLSQEQKLRGELRTFIGNNPKSDLQ